MIGRRESHPPVTEKWLLLCESLTCRALARLSPGLAIAARTDVVVVPMFEPKDNGYALSMLITPIPGGNTKHT